MTTLADSGPGSLRAALSAANGNGSADVIEVQPGLTGTITLTSSGLVVSEAVSIIGPGAGLLNISGNNTFRVLNTQSAPAKSAVSLSGLTLSNGKANDGGAIYAADESLTLTNCAITGSTVTSRGGGIYVYSGGALTMTNCVLSKNSSGNSGGAVRIRTGSIVTVSNCTIEGNSAGGAGGGLSFNSFASLLLENSTITGNTAVSNGGGVSLPNYQGASGLLIRNCTFTSNIGGDSAGAIGVLGVSTVTLQHCTITGNTATGGRGGGIGMFYHASTVNIENCVVSGNINALGPDIGDSQGSKINLKNSAVGSSFGFDYTDKGGNLAFMTDLKLGPLADNGGPTKTRHPAADSPLLDAGSVIANLTTDQRGLPFVRAAGFAPDIGAVEVQHTLAVTNLNDSGAGSLRRVIADALVNPGADTIVFQPGLTGTITLTTGELALVEPLAILGPGPNIISIHGNNAGRIFNTSTAPANAPITLGGLTLTGGSADRGGAMFVQDERLTLIECAIVNNSATISGGGIHVELGGAPIVVLRSTLADNFSAGNAAGLYLAAGALTIVDSTLARNMAVGAEGGGALVHAGAGSIAIRNSTLSGNSAVNLGGAVLLPTTFTGAVAIQNSTITANTAGSGGGIARAVAAGTIDLESTILAGNVAGTIGPDILTPGTVNAVTSLLGTLAGIASFNGDAVSNGLVGKAPMLQPLANNGGPTPTHALLPTSPAIGNGSNPLPNLTTDQRGQPRSVGNIDIGAFELQPAAKVSTFLVGDGTAQRSTVTSLKVVFDTHVTFVNLPATAFSLTRQSDGKAVALSAAVNDSGPTTTVTLTFTSGAVDGVSLADGRYTLTLAAQQLSDSLDGNSDGTAGDDFVVVGAPGVGPRLFRLFGDADGDGDTDSTDFGAFRTAFGASSSVFDFDNDGDVDTSDFAAFRIRFGASV